MMDGGRESKGVRRSCVDQGVHSARSKSKDVNTGSWIFFVFLNFFCVFFFSNSSRRGSVSACPCDRGGNVGGGSQPRKNPNREETEAIRTRYLQKEK